MSKPMKVLLVLVMISAFSLMTGCILHYLDLGKDLLECENSLSASRASWQSIASEKEALQEDLKAIQKKLNETQLSLTESTGRARELKEEIESLRKEIDALKSPVIDFCSDIR